MKIEILALMTILLMAGVVSALPIYVKPLSSGELQPSTTFNYFFNFTTDSACSNVLLSSSHLITTGTDGIGFAEVNTSSLISVPRYLCEYREGSLRKVHELSDGLFRNVYARNIYAENWTNVSITESQITNLQTYILNTDQRYNETNLVKNWSDFLAVSNINVNNKNILNIANTTYNGDEYFYKKRGATMFYWNATDGTKQNYHYLDPDNNAIDYIVDVVLGASNSLYINDAQYSQTGIFKSGLSGIDFDISNADPTIGGVTIEGGMLDINSNDGLVNVGSGTSFAVTDLLSCDADNDKIETDASGLFYCGVATGGSANFTNVAYLNNTQNFTGVNNFNNGLNVRTDFNFTNVGITTRRSFNFVNTTNGIRQAFGFFFGTGANSYLWWGRNDTLPTSLNNGALMRFFDNTPGRLEIYGDTPGLRLTGMRSSGGTIIPIFDMYGRSTSTNLTNAWGQIIVYGDMGSGSTPPSVNYWCAGAHNNTAFNNCTLKWNTQQRLGIAISGTTQPSYPLDVRTNVSGITINSEGAILTNGLNSTSHVRATGLITTANASAWKNYAVCYVDGGTLGHCTDVVNSTGGCTCVSN